MFSYKEKLQRKITLGSFLSILGGGCGSVGRAVASDSRGPWFKIHLSATFNVHCITKTNIKEKEAGNGPLKNMHIISECLKQRPTIK